MTLIREKSRKSIRLDYENQIKSLVWRGDDLVDLVSGGILIDTSQGRLTGPSVTFGYKFDSAVLSNDGKYAVLYERFGTKAVVLEGMRHVRELNRSYYHADVYEYPFCFIKLRDDSWGIVHCPEEYNVIEIERIDDGKRITVKNRSDVDFFQSRLEISPDQKWLLSAGWVWHPLDSILLYDLSTRLEDPPLLSQVWQDELSDIGLWEVNNATFLSDSRLLLSGKGDQVDEDASDEIALVVYDLTQNKMQSRVEIGEPTGKLMAVDSSHAICFFRHPKLIEISTGQVKQRWDDIETDDSDSSISFLNKHSIMAFDSINKRFAVASGSSIEIVQLY